MEIDHGVIAAGIRDQFWGQVKMIFEDVRREAHEELVNCDPSNTSRITELQQMFKMTHHIERVVEDYAQEEEMRRIMKEEEQKT